MSFDFNRYLEAFNAHDGEVSVAEFYTEDLIVEGPDRTMHGREEWLNVLRFNHHGVEETLVPIMTVRDGDNIMVETNAVFVASVDRPDFLMAPLKAGQTLAVRFFASYRLRGDKIAMLTLAWWPPGLRSV